MNALPLVGDCRSIPLPDGSVDAVVTDPPYGLAFMGKAWDHDVPGPDYWREVYRVMKPGAHLLAFGGTRTWHWLTVGIEEAGFEVRDCLSWMYGTGFPKSDALLKPGWEPVVVAWKDGGGGVVPLNIDACRIGVGPSPSVQRRADGAATKRDGPTYGEPGSPERSNEHRPSEMKGRWPANVTLSHSQFCIEPEDEDGEWSCPPSCPVRQLDEQSGESSCPDTVTQGSKDTSLMECGPDEIREVQGYGDTGGASRFYYCAKASRGEREAGLPDVEGRVNSHPTVKPIDLCRWLVRLVTRKGHLVLDPFMGSGSIGCAALQERRRYIGLDLEPEYVEIARARLEHWAPKQVDMFKDAEA